MILSVKAEKAFEKCNMSFMTKVLERARIQEAYINRIRTINSQPTVNIKQNGDKLKANTLKSGTR